MINENKYLFCNISDYKIIDNQIQKLLKNIEDYLKGPVFKESANKVLKNYYEVLTNEIKRRLD
jgi:hypothetical protein